MPLTPRPTILAAALALLAMAALCHGQATQPSVPGFRPFSGPIVSPFGTPGYWLYLADRQDATPALPDGYQAWLSGPNVEGFPVLIVRPVRAQPATVPVVAPPPQPPVSVPAYDVQPGGDWVAAVMAAAPGATVRLAPGTYAGWPEHSKRPPKGVTVAGAGMGKTVLHGTRERVVYAWCWDGVTVQDLTLTYPGDPAGNGIQANGCFDLTLLRVQATNCWKGAVIESAGGRRSRNVRILDGDYSDNWKPNGSGRDSSGIYVDRCDGYEILRNTINRNGWKPGRHPGGDGNHGAYLTGDNNYPISVTGNVVEDNSSHGIQARAGGTVEDNRFARNPIHLSFGLVNGGGPIKLGGVTGSIRRNRYAATRLLSMYDDRRRVVSRQLGYCIEVANVSPDGVVIGDNWAYDDTPAPDARLVKVAWLKVDRCDLERTNPHWGKEVGVRRLTVQANAVTWPTNVGTDVWVHDSIKQQAARPRDGAVLALQTVFPPAAR